MNENKQNNPEEKQVPDKELRSSAGQTSYKAGKKLNPDILKWLIIGLAAFAVVVLIFSAGMFVGGTKARFSYRWAESYQKNFGGPRAGFLGDWRKLPLAPDDFIEGHGTFGEIIKINDPDFVIKGQNDVEKVIITTEDTSIKRGMKTIKKEELKVGDRVVVIGSPNEQGQIEAKLIRVFNGEGKGLPKDFPIPFFK